MSLDIRLIQLLPTEVFWSNITHNLGEMARAVQCKNYEHSLYEYLWRPEEIWEYRRARHLIFPLKALLAELKENPEKYEKYNAKNGFGLYSQLVNFVTEYLEACERSPDAKIEVSR